MTVIAKNKQAYFEYEILEEIEAGMVLKGWEVKSIKAGNLSLKESYIDIHKEQASIRGMHVNIWKFANSQDDLVETRTRKLLLSKRQIKQLSEKQKIKGLTIVPLNIHLHHGFLKIQIALARGKKLGDKRESVKDKEQKREIDRDLKRAGY